MSGLVRCKHCGHNFWGCVLKNSAGEIRYYADGGYRAQGDGVCKATHIQAAALDGWVLDQLRSTYLADKAGVARAIEEFVKTCCGRVAASKARPDRSRELADLNKRIKTTVALLSDSDLADVGELRTALVDLKRRRETLEADVATKPASPNSIDPDCLRAWAREQVAGLSQALKPGTPMMEARAAVHAFIPKIEIDPNRKVGTLYLPRDTCSALQAAFVRRDTSASSIHSCTTLPAARGASPR
ncbi:MAG: zinc ribbon domain-containing protein [Phycisphaerales bacterium]